VDAWVVPQLGPPEENTRNAVFLRKLKKKFKPFGRCFTLATKDEERLELEY
jgi:hypothetical protein